LRPTDTYAQIELRILREERWPASLRDTVKLFADWGLSRSPQETVWIVAYNSIKDIRTVIEVARGAHNTVDLHIPTALAAVLTSGGVRFTLVHSHPSNDPRPSMTDETMTATILTAANACGLYMEDHLIVTPGGRHFSYKAAGLFKAAIYPGTGERHQQGVA
jgi:DNA repair protein RadC